MNEKRFQVINVRWQGKGEAVAFEDTQTNQVYFAENQEECKRIVELLNEQQDIIEELRLQEKEKGVPVFVVRNGKNPVALFFNEQRASWYCQENMAHLTYQQEKWCRVE